MTRQRPRNGPNDTPRQRQRTGSGGTPGKSEPAAEPAILFQEYFKSAGPRTYAAQVKQAANGNHFLVLTEGKRDRDSDALKKCSLYLFSEDFPAFFRMLKSAAEFIKAHPVPPEVKQRRAAYWARQKKGGRQTRDSGRSATG